MDDLACSQAEATLVCGADPALPVRVGLENCPHRGRTSPSGRCPGCTTRLLPFASGLLDIPTPDAARDRRHWLTKAEMAELSAIGASIVLCVVVAGTGTVPVTCYTNDLTEALEIAREKVVLRGPLVLGLLANIADISSHDDEPFARPTSGSELVTSSPPNSVDLPTRRHWLTKAELTELSAAGVTIQLCVVVAGTGTVPATYYTTDVPSALAAAHEIAVLRGPMR